MSVTMSTVQRFTVQLSPEDALDNPGTLDAPPSWNVDTPGVVTLEISSDGLTCTVVGEAAGTCTITPTATSGGGANAITGSPILVTVTAPTPGPATQLVEDIGPVTNQ